MENGQDPFGRSRLPIWRYREQIVDAVKRHQVVIIAGETGSGKTTQLPQFCLQAGLGKRCLGVTQPRRIATTSLARRLADEMGCELGEVVGYKIRFQQKWGPRSRVKVMTDGILLTELQQDARLSQYDTIIVDEAHERSLNIDFVLGLLKQLLPQRPDLRVIVTSATIDTEKFSAYFHQAPVLQVEGRGFPVEVRYRPTEETPLSQQAADCLGELLGESHSGDALIFLPTEADIHDTCRIVAGRHPHLEVLPLFARLPANRQQQIFQASTKRRVVVSTNIAETSLTIPAIRYVIDSGLARIGRYHSSNSTFSLLVSPIPQSSADQRAGRCGRVQHGVCVRLYSLHDYQRRPRYLQPEIQRANLASVILQMLHLGLQPGTFDLIDNPSRAAFQEGLRTLKELKAIVTQQGRHQLTEVGKRLVRLPLDPRLAAVLLQADQEGALEEALTLVTVLGMQDVRERPLDAAMQADASHRRFRDHAFARKIFPERLVQRIPTLQAAKELPLGGRRNLSPGKGEEEQPLSDLLGLLLLWHYSQQLRAKVSNSQWRKICRADFLSATRLREWSESRQQVARLLEEGGLKVRPYTGENVEAALYRSVARGFLSHLGQREEAPPVKKTARKPKAAEKNNYRFARSRSAKIHPGSHLFQAPPPWVIAVELVQTSALYARCVFPVSPKMIIPLAGELCQRQLIEPHWSRSHGRVMAREKVLLFGLLLDQGRLRPYGPAQAAEAQAIFIRQALLQADFHPAELTLLPFIEENLRRVASAQTTGDKLRRPGLALGEEGLYQFYQKVLAGQTISDRHTLVEFARRQNPSRLLVDEEHLYAQLPPADMASLFPDTIRLGADDYQLDYRFQPGAEDDGVSIRVSIGHSPPLKSIHLPLVVPGYLAEGIEVLMQLLPASVRRQLAPRQEKLTAILPGVQHQLAQHAQISDQVFRKILSGELARRCDIVVVPSLWRLSALPPHLKIRLLLCDPQQREIETARDLAILSRNLIVAPGEDEYQRAAKQWHRQTLKQWPDCGPLPARIELDSGLVYPALLAQPLEKVWGKAPPGSSVYQRGCETQLQPSHCGHDPLLQPLIANQLAIGLDHAELKTVALRLLSDSALASALHPLGCAWLVAWQHRRLLQDLRRGFRFDALSFPRQLWGGPEKAARICFGFAVERVLRCHAREKKDLWQHSEQLRSRLASDMGGWLQLWRGIVAEAWRLQLQLEQASAHSPYRSYLKSIEQRWNELLDPFLFSLQEKESIPYLQRLPCYLQGLKVRLERGLLNPAKDAAKERRAQPLVARYQQEYARPQPSVPRLLALRSCLWALEEIQLECFAPELKSRSALSAKQLLSRFDQILGQS